MKEALLIVNMGGPINVQQVRGYLREIFHDPAILPLPAALRFPLAALISSRRESAVAHRYQQIGGGSPLLLWTQCLRNGLVAALYAEGESLPVAFAFRYSSPTLAESLRELHEDGINSIRLLPLFPHYTKAMTGSIVAEATRVAALLGIQISSVIEWGRCEVVLRLWSDYLLSALQEAGTGARVLFVAHGIPLRNVRRGEDYPVQVMDTARTLASNLPASTEWSLAYQSKVGPVKWTGPYLEAEIERLAKSSKPLVIMPLSFVADCLETLYDLDLIATVQAQAGGIKKVVRAPAFNDDPRFAQALAAIVMEGVEVAC
jgi:ferrochelatase